jgi:hypothetical protein
VRSVFIDADKPLRQQLEPYELVPLDKAGKATSAVEGKRMPSPSLDSDVSAPDGENEEVPEHDGTDARLTRLINMSQALVLQARLQNALNDAIDPEPSS